MAEFTGIGGGLQGRTEHGRDNVVEFNPKRIFTIEEVNNLLPIIKKITEEYSQTVQAMISRFENMKGRSEGVASDLEKDINDRIQTWQNKMEKLGVRAKGLWLADFDSGDGYFCWKFPEERVCYWHAYTDGFRGRVPIEERAQEKTGAMVLDYPPDLNA